MTEENPYSPSSFEGLMARNRRQMEAEMFAIIGALREEDANREAQSQIIQTEGEAALARLFAIASRRDCGQAGVLVAFLLGLYNGRRFRFDLTDLRRLDRALHDDCMAVLRMDHQPSPEVDNYFDNGEAMFEQLAIHWRLEDFYRMRLELDELKKQST